MNWFLSGRSQPMSSLPRKTLGRTGLEVTQLGYGAMEVRGNRIWNGRPCSDEQARTILRAVVESGINFIDVAGAEMLTNESQRRRRLQGGLYICGLKQEAREILCRGDYLDIIGNDNIFTSETEAISKICSRLDSIECHQCQAPLFQECKALFDSENRQ